MPTTDNQLPLVLVTLMKGVTYREEHPDLWESLLVLHPRVHDYVGQLGLEVILDEAEGYAYLRQRPVSADVAEPSGEQAPEIPRLIARRQLGYAVSLLLVLLRKRLLEFDARSGESRLIMSRDEILELIRLFMPDATNEAKIVDRVDTHIAKAVDLGFLRPLQGRTDQFEVRRILKAFVDAQWLMEFDTQLVAYKAHVDSHD